MKRYLLVVLALLMAVPAFAAFNGSGTFVRVHNWQEDADNDIDILPDRMDEEFDGMATGLSTCVTKDGQTTLTANIPFNGRKITGYGTTSAPSSRSDVPSLGQVQDGKLFWVDSGGTADAITATYSPAVTALVDGQLAYVRAGFANATATPTFAPSGLTAHTIVKGGGQALVAGDIRGDGHELILRYDLSNTRWELLDPYTALTSSLTTLSTAFTPASASGPASLAMAEDTDNGTNKVTITAPASIASDVAITLPGVASTLATLAGTETLTNKSIAVSQLTSGTLASGVGASATSYSAGTESSGTFTPDCSNGNFQHATNGGAHTLAPPSTVCSLVVEYLNNGSAGAVTTSGFTKVTGDSLTTTNGNKFHLYITKTQNYSHLNIVALQ